VSGRFTPADIGEVGRRAIAWFVHDGLVVDATDAATAAQAMDIVAAAMKQAGRPLDSRFRLWIGQAMRMFPVVPDEACSLGEVELGRFEADADRVGLGYGYVRPMAGGHECGGAIFDQERQAAATIGPFRIRLTVPAS